MPDEPVWLEPLQRVGLALAIGFLVGVERGWKQRDDGEGQRVAGIRTFALIGLLGGVSGLLLPAVGATPVAAMALGFGASFAAFQFRQAMKDGDNSVTSTVAGLLVFALGLYAVVGETVVAAAVAVAGTTVLAFKEGAPYLASVDHLEGNAIGSPDPGGDLHCPPLDAGGRCGSVGRD